MPSPLAHCSVALFLWPPLRSGVQLPITPIRRLALLGLLLVALVAPDFDILLDPLMGRPAFTIHGGPTHSLVAGLIFGVPFALIGRAIAPIGLGRLFLLGVAAYWSHVLLDFVTRGGGVALFWPFMSERIASPIPIFYGVRHDQPLALHLHAITLANEAAFFGLVWWLARRWSSRMRTTADSPPAAARRTPGAAP